MGNIGDVDRVLGLSDAELILGFMAIFLPLLIAIVMQPQWSDRVRYTVSLVIYVAFAFLMLWFLNYVVFDNETTARDYVRAFLLSGMVGFGAFKLVWQPTDIAYSIENRTS